MANVEKHRIAVFVKNLTSGGAEKQAVLLAKAMADCHDVHYIIFNGDKVHQKYMDMLHEDKRISIASFVGGHLKRFHAFQKYLRIHNIDFVFSYLTAANLYACCAGAITSTKVFTGIRNAELPLGKRIADKFMTNHFAYKTVINCFSGAEAFAKQGFRDDKMIVIPNCFENITPYAEKEQKECVRVITVGRFVEQKDYATAIKAISIARKNCPALRYDIVGYGELEEEVRRLVKQSEIEDCTTIHINPDNIPELLDQADVYLSTSLFEGTSNSIMEGMNANLPIIATNVGDNYKLVENEKNGFLVNTKDSKAIADAIVCLYNSCEKRKEMAKLSKRLLLDNYSIEIFRDRYNSIIA